MSPKDTYFCSVVSAAIQAILQDGRISAPIDWLNWAYRWLEGVRSPAACVDVAHRVCSGLGQIAWAAKESCYDTPQSGWLVMRYIADAMLSLGLPARELVLYTKKPEIE
jgi:hypothetical protein